MTYRRAEEVAAFARDLIARHGGQVLPTEFRMAMEAAGFDYWFWIDTPVLMDLLALELRPAYEGHETKHYVLKREEARP